MDYSQLSPSQAYQPQLFDPSKSTEKAALKALRKSHPDLEIIEGILEAVEDLFKIDFPYIQPGSPEFKATFLEYEEDYYGGRPAEEAGIWAYFPWRNSLVHLPHSADFLKLRTARNKFLITQKEQDQFYAATIGIAGLSVGSSVLSSISLSGGSGHVRIGDPDTLAITNLNRLPSSVCDLGRSKCHIAARKLYEINPFQEIDLFEKGLSSDNIPDFLGDKAQKLDLLVEEMDDILLKITIRFEARKRGIPVLMVTDNGDNAIIDVERFDLDTSYPLFHGSVPEEVLSSVPAKPSMAERVRLAATIVGFDITPRTQSSLMQVGSKLPSWPQLGNAATLSGAAASYVARRIITGQSMPSGRYEVNLDSSIDPEFHTEEAVSNRAEARATFVEGFTLLYAKKTA